MLISLQREEGKTKLFIKLITRELGEGNSDLHSINLQILQLEIKGYKTVVNRSSVAIVS